MKLLVAGPMKSGTKSMNSALDTLGYSVYDYTENAYFLNKEWMDIFQGKGTVEHFRRMYEDVDATMDTPAYLFWKEILQAFPDCKGLFISPYITMKVVVAGPLKTGTKSMNSALDTLGYSVYDFTENAYFLNKEWMEIFQGKGTVEHFRRIYEDVDATVDVPSYWFWKEILQAFPNCKIVLTVRDNEDVWVQSAIKQIELIRTHKLFLTSLHCTPIGRKWLKFQKHLDYYLFGFQAFCLCGDPINEMTLRQHYRRQLADVMQNAPKDQLLVFNCTEGWEPLCNFLGVPVPEDVPFPHRNMGQKGDFKEKHMDTKPLLKELSYQFNIVKTLASACVLSFGFFAYRYFIKK